MNPRMIPELHDRHMDRLLGRQEDEDAANEAEREEGAGVAVRELVRLANRSGKSISEACFDEPEEMRRRMFIANFCGAIEFAFPELAIAIAKGAGMGNLYPEE